MPASIIRHSVKTDRARLTLLIGLPSRLALAALRLVPRAQDRIQRAHGAAIQAGSAFNLQPSPRRPFLFLLGALGTAGASTFGQPPPAT